MPSRLLAVLAAVAGCCMLATSALAAPQLQIEMTHANAYGLPASECPTHSEEYVASEPEKDCGVDPFTGSGTTFAQESGYNTFLVSIKNIATGEANGTSGLVTVEVAAPQGVEAIGEFGSVPAEGAGWTCSSTRTTISCFRSTRLAAGASFPPIAAHFWVTSEASPGTPPTGGATATATVNGGGAPHSSTANSATVVPATPFGISTFETAITELLGRPFTQAGGHPLAAKATFIFNSTPELAGGLWTARGTPKDIETELPPGFFGDAENATRCTAAELASSREPGEDCPAGSAVGFVEPNVSFSAVEAGKAEPFWLKERDLVYNVQPPPGSPASFAFIIAGAYYELTAMLRDNGNYGITIGDSRSGFLTGYHGVQALSLTFCGYGVIGHGGQNGTATAVCASPGATVPPLLTNPTRCEGAAPTTTLSVATYQHPTEYIAKTVYNGSNLLGGAPSATESFVTGCNLLQFTPEIELSPSAGTKGTTALDQPTGTQFNLKVPQAKEEAGVNATPALKTATVTLPEGMTANPAAANGLEACSDAQFGLDSTLEPAEPAHCPLASQVGTVEVCTPLLANQTGEAHSGEEVDQQCEDGKAAPVLQGQAFIGQPECSPCSAVNAEEGKLFRLFLQIRAPERGVIVKLAGHISANPLTGRLQATFDEQPQLPFGELRLRLKGGPRAPLATPQTCGAATTTSVLTPWSAPGTGGLTGTEPIAGTPNAEPMSTFTVDWNGAGGTCPSTLPFSPTFAAGTESSTAGASSPLSVTLSRQDREQDLAGLIVSTPPGLLGKVSEVSQCPEAEANAGTCPASSQIGTATVAVGAGADPYWLTGTVYLTGPYNGDPYGLSVAVPAEAGPFKLAGNASNGIEVVRAGIAVNPTTAALTIMSDLLPQVVDGVQLRLRTVHIDVSRPGFIVNPTSCTQLSIGATITGSKGTATNTSSPFGPTGCTALPFHPTIAASASPQTSIKTGASLTVAVTATPSEANIGRVDLTVPKALPSRQSTLQQACTESQFATNPAACPNGSDIGTATARTPLLTNSLTGPIYLVSQGGAAFPDIEFVLQGEHGLTIVLDSKTQIANGVTYSRLESLPDAPISSFIAQLPRGPHSILGAPTNLCTAQKLALGVTAIGQNGKQETESVPIAVNGCRPSTSKPTLTRAQKLAAALTTCHKRHKHAKAKRLACERLARKRYGPKASKSRRPT